MQSFRSVAVLCWFLVASGAVRAQEAVVIKLKARGAGDAIIIKKSDSVTIKLKIEDAKGKVLHDQNETKTVISEFKETVIQRPVKKLPTKLERDYVKMQTTIADKSEISALQGKTVVIEKKDGKYTFAFKEGGAISGPALAALLKDFGKKDDSSVGLNQLMLPKAAVKPGDIWKLDMNAVFKELIKGDGDMDVDSAKGVGTGKLLKSYQNAGRQFGEMQFMFEAPLKSMGKEAQQMRFNAGAKMAMNMVLNTCIDGSTEEGSIRITTNLGGTASLASLPGSVVTLSVAGVIQGTQEEPVKKK